MKFLQVVILTGLIGLLLLLSLFAFDTQNRYAFHLRTAGYFLIALSVGFYYLLKKIKRSNKLNLAILLVGIGTGITILLFDHFNIIVGYEEWFERGCPDHPFK